MRYKGLLFTTIALFSFATLLFELTQIRLLSFIFWNHIVYLTLSFALLGFGIGGTLTAVFSKRLKLSRLNLSILLSTFAITIGVASLTVNCVAIMASVSNALAMVLAHLIFLPTYIVSGSAISIILSAKKCHVGKLYAADLVSAGLACLIFFFALPALGPGVLIGIIATACSLTAAIWLAKRQRLGKLYAFALRP